MNPILRLFNTLTRKKEPFQAQEPPRVRMYTCGPTVYNFAHIGNFRTYVFEDLLRRTLKLFGYQVEQAMNLTDIDDKTLKGANAEGVTLAVYTEPYKKAFFEDLKTLHIEQVEYYPAATEYIAQMIQLIQRLLDKGVAYRATDGSIYFSIRKFPHYGCLSHLHLEELKEGGSGVLLDEYDKEHAADFVLWKGYDEARDGSVFWESPFGRGRPGWHLECSTMAMELLGETLDIHVGGVDNIFPHHENEIAQSEAATGKQFAHFWLHSEHLIVDQRKMSKSLGNFYTLRDLLERGYSGTEVRMVLLHVHYRAQLNFTFEGLDSMRSSLQRLRDCVRRLRLLPGRVMVGDQFRDHRDRYENLLTLSQKHFEEALADDLNISLALAAVFNVVTEVHRLCDLQVLDRTHGEEILALLRRFDVVLGVLFVEEEEPVPAAVQDLFKQRQQVRKDKQWARSDELRAEIAALGYVVEDGAGESTLKKNGSNASH